jgi:flavin-dependent dehydrogenase
MQGVRSGNPDVFVIGGGPAGSTAARLLANWGWTVALAHRPWDGPTLAESLPPSTKKLLTFLGQLDTVGSADFFPNHGNVAFWAGTMRETRTDEPGFHVSRASFDALLRQSARGAGVSILDGVVRRVDVASGPAIDLVTIAGERHRIEPRFLLDCSGRASIAARHGGFGRKDASYRTLALAAEWVSDDWPADEKTRTIVESYQDGWAWSVPLSDTRRQLTVMADPRSAGLSRDGAPAEHALQHIYGRTLEAAGQLAARARKARQVSRPWGSNASIYCCTAPCAEGVLLVGDAASFIEPLSSAGVKKAMMSAWRAAVVANTCLAKPAMSAHALVYYLDREREVFAECQRFALEFFREAAAWHDTPFWASRVEEVVPSPHPEDDEGPVRIAHARLREADRVRLRPSSALRFGSTPDIEGCEVVLRDGIVVPGSDTPTRFAAGVNLPALVRIASEFDEVPAIFSAYHAHVGPAPVDNLVTALSVLVARHALLLEDARS